MADTFTTTMRWEEQELNDVKIAAERIGLPTSLFIKSIVLSQVRHVKLPFQTSLVEDLMTAKREIENGDYDFFNSKEALISDLKTYVQ